jgi:hypothetical protein
LLRLAPDELGEQPAPTARAVGCGKMAVSVFLRRAEVAGLST